MPSLQSLMLVALAALQLSSATPLPQPAQLAVDCSKPVTPAPALPASALPGTDLALQYVVIGRGVQNYSCASTTAAPVAIGAIATLYDATALAKINLNLLHTIPGIVVKIPLPAAGSPLSSQFKNIPSLGHHFFLADGTPTFDLTSVKKILFAKKLAGTPAPAGAPTGPNGSGAVDWLQLGAKDPYVSVGASMVYRVETAGGKAPAVCPSVGVITVQYAAEYWFYL